MTRFMTAAHGRVAYKGGAAVLDCMCGVVVGCKMEDRNRTVRRCTTSNAVLCGATLCCGSNELEVGIGCRWNGPKEGSLNDVITVNRPLEMGTKEWIP